MCNPQFDALRRLGRERREFDSEEVRRLLAEEGRRLIADRTRAVAEMDARIREEGNRIFDRKARELAEATRVEFDRKLTVKLRNFTTGPSLDA